MPPKKKRTLRNTTVSNILPDLAIGKTKAADILYRVVHESNPMEIVGLEKESLLELIQFMDLCMAVDTPAFTSDVFVAFQTLNDGERARLTESFSHTQLAQIGVAACLITARRNGKKASLSELFKRIIDEKTKDSD